MITMRVEEFLRFVDDCLDSMLDVVEALGDELANEAPQLPGANSPYAILTHCLGVINWWGGVTISGREVVRDRDAEFVATGPVAPLREEVRRTRDRLDEDLWHLDPEAAPIGPPNEPPAYDTQAGVLLHVFHELAQHLGQMEVTRDVLVASRGSTSP